MSDSLIAERSIFGLLTDVYSMELIVLEGFESKFLPTADIRFIFDWAVQQYQLTGNIYAPTPLMFEGANAPGHKKSLADVLRDYDIDINEVPDQTVEWCIQELRATWLRKNAILQLQDLGTEVNEAMAAEMTDTYSKGVAGLVAMQLDLESRRTSHEMVSGAHEILERYQVRAANPGFKGMTLGLAELDEYTNGIDYGELAVLAGPQKSGKSYVADLIALKELQAGHSVCLVSLENGMEMTIDRIACIATHTDPTRFKAGRCTPEEVEAITTWINEDFSTLSEQLWIVRPPQGQRTAEQIISSARTRKVDSLIIDQLLWMEDVNDAPPLNQRIRDRMTTIKVMIESSARPMPCLLLHQVNRAGIESAKKAGRLWPNDMAEGAAVEQTADWVFSLWQSEDMKVANQLLMQTLASRREAIKNWDIYFDMETGVFRFMNETSV